jgi:hypothetical protein
MRKLSQKQRVLKAARAAGTTGLTSVDFLLPDVIDGGKPITRLAARIEELEADGIRFWRDGRRNGCVIYVLDAAHRPALRPPAQVAPPEPGAEMLFDPRVGVAPPASPYTEAA